MPRRPRPASRRPPQYAFTSAAKSKTAPRAPRVKSAQARLSREESESEQSSASSSSGGFFEGGDFGADPSGSEGEEEDLEEGRINPGDVDDAEPDAPRVAQWVDDEELDEIEEDEEDPESSDDEETRKSRLQEGLQSLSFGALRKARKALAQSSTLSDSDEEDHSDEENHSDVSEPEPTSYVRGPHFDKGKEKEGPNRQKKEIPKRRNKHAPTEMSSKRPVSRSRFVAEQKANRDPRFVPVTGDFEARRFHAQYGFLSDMHQEELTTLRENLKRARKLLANSPRDLRGEREAEVDRLERAVKRAESSVNKDRRETVEMEALCKATKEEREKRKQGKKAWYLKSADKKELLLRAKYDALAERGGRGAVRKAIEKKQKKANQKEKKKRPFARGPPSGSAHEGPARLKRSHPDGDGESRKRRRRS